jgi:phosphatidylglycerophosphatase A
VNADPPSSESPRASAHGADRADEAARVAKPRFALLIATALGLGYIPIAPGTFGSLAGLVVLCWSALTATGSRILLLHLVVAFIVAAIGVWSADRAAIFWQQKDPQRVVIDEVSGQHLTLLLGIAAPLWRGPQPISHFVLSWKYLVVGFILFRVFDIWKPFPVRDAESLPGGWGIMADDWVAGLYAALGLWIVRAAGL